jgi:uncharacterized protein (DUF697 family)
LAPETSVSDDNNQEIKIKRSRRRLYEESPVLPKLDTDPVSDDTLATSVAKIIKKNMYWSMGIGVLPFPVFDFFAFMVLQINMVREIARLYKQPFQEQRGKSIILSLLGGLNTLTLTGVIARSFLKYIPGIGTLMAIGSSSIIAGATTFAVGKVFVQHFEMGGTLLSLNPEDVKEYFRQQYQIGEQNLKIETGKK